MVVVDFPARSSDGGVMAEGPLTVTVEAGFGEDGIWIIDARLVWRDGLPLEGSNLLGHGRIALLAAVAREGANGRSLGATRVRVHMSGHQGEHVTIGEPVRGDRG